jgi:hypothetical protein
MNKPVWIATARIARAIALIFHTIVDVGGVVVVLTVTHVVHIIVDFGGVTERILLFLIHIPTDISGVANMFLSFVGGIVVDAGGIITSSLVEQGATHCELNVSLLLRLPRVSQIEDTTKLTLLPVPAANEVQHHSSELAATGQCLS